MFTMSDLFPKHEGAQIKILDQVFTLTKEIDLSGELAKWYNDSFIIYATPMFDNIPIPIDIMTAEYMELDCDSSYQEVLTFEEYCKKVKEISENILNEQSIIIRSL